MIFAVASIVGGTIVTSNTPALQSMGRHYNQYKRVTLEKACMAKMVTADYDLDIEIPSPKNMSDEDGSIDIVKVFDKELSGENVLPGFILDLNSLKQVLQVVETVCYNGEVLNQRSLIDIYKWIAFSVTYYALTLKA